MMLDVSKPIITLDGDTIHDTEGGPVTTLAKICVQALLTNDQSLKDGAEKYRRYKLAERISEADPLADLEVEEISLIKKLVGVRFGAIVVGPVYDLLEGGALPAPKELRPASTP